MKNIILGALTLSLSAVWAAPALAAEADGWAFGRDGSEGPDPGRTSYNPPPFNPLPPWGGCTADEEHAVDSTESPELCCCAGEDVAEAQQCWDWPCAAGIVGGAIVAGLGGYSAAGPWGAGLGALGGGLVGYATNPACTP